MDNEYMTNLNKALSRTNGLYQKWYQIHELNSYKIQTLYALYMEPTLSQKQISENYQMPRQTVNNTVQALKKQGYVNLIPDELDGRGRKIIFTEAGYAYATEVLAPILSLDQQVINRMGIKKFIQLTELLLEYGNALEIEINQGDQS